MNRRSSSRARASQAGFTLVELLAAVIAGLFVVLAAFMLSRGATRLFASENRMGITQLNTRLGAEQLRVDLQRAGFMSSANIVNDPDVCPDPNNTVSMAKVASRIQSLFFVQGTAATSSVRTPQSAANSLTPDTLYIQGNFATADSYIVADIETGSSGWTINFQRNNGAMQRLVTATTVDGALAYYQRVFPTNSVIRLTNTLGSSQFLVVSGVAVGSNGAPQLTVGTSPSLTYVTASQPRCGAVGLCMGCTVNPVKTYGYQVRSLASSATFSYAYVSASDPAADNSTNTKYDLVRAEYAAMPAPAAGALTPIAGTETIVAEYVADLRFAFTIDTGAAPSPGVPWIQPSVVSYAFGDATAAGYVGDVTISATAAPQRVRSVRFKLAARSREIDRTDPLQLPNTSATAPGNIVRYQVGTNQYTRMRTIQSEVLMANQQASRW